MPSLSALLADRRKLFLALTGAVVVVALVVVVAVVVLGGDDDNGDAAAGPSGPIELTAPATSDVFNLAGDPAQLSPPDLEAVLSAVEGYLTAAALEAPTTRPPEEGDDTTTTAPGTPAPSDPRPFFTSAAAAQFDTDAANALSDGHLAPADGASPRSATVPSLAGLVGDDGAGQLVVITIDVTTVVDLEDDVIVHRTGDLVIEATADGWRISGYDLAVERTRGSETTTTEAAFGRRGL